MDIRELLSPPLVYIITLGGSCTATGSSPSPPGTQKNNDNDRNMSDSEGLAEGDSLGGDKDLAVKKVREEFRAENVVLIVKRSDYTKGKIILACDRAGQPRNRYSLDEETRKRDKGTRKGVGCTFTVALRRRGPVGRKEWFLHSITGEHNHDGYISTLLELFLGGGYIIICL